MEGTRAFITSCELVPAIRRSCVSLICLSSGVDKSSRYVAEENIIPLEETPAEGLMKLAGRHFKRWDDQSKVFVSNIKDEYPDD